MSNVPPTATSLPSNGNDATKGNAEVTNIEHLIHQRAIHRQQGEWALADGIKQTLEATHGVQLSDRDNPFHTTWRFAPPPRVVEWTELDVTSISMAGSGRATPAPHPTPVVPLVINTVDTPHYRTRFQLTKKYLETEWQPAGSPPLFCVQKCDLLDLRQFPTVGAKGILMKGWQTILLPWLTNRQSHPSNDARTPATVATTILPQNASNNFVLVAEDDLRFPPNVSPAWLYHQCRHVFAAHPTIHVLSLGHSWSTLSRSQQQQQQQQRQQDSLHSVKGDDSSSTLLSFLQSKPTSGLHATTLLAIRVPDGVTAMQQALQGTKLQHLDQFLFHSPLHNIAMAFSDPPLAGWAEVEESLTKSGSGHRRRGGGRLGNLPPFSSTVRWVQRRTRIVDHSLST